MTATNPPALSTERLASLDAYRGFIMICLAANGFGLAQTAKNMIARHPEQQDFWEGVRYQFDHVPWTGCGFWDLIQPSFMFMVGVALPYSLSKRSATGDDGSRRGFHAWVRAVVLILLGVLLSSNSRNYTQTNFAFMNVLSQIGLGYFFLYLLCGRKLWVQGLTAAAILAGYWAWFVTGPLPPTDFDYATVGVKPGFPLLSGFEAHWQKNANVAATFDVWFLNLFPQQKPFVFNEGGYQTLNFIPSLATMIFGLMAGEFIRRSTHRGRTFLLLMLAGLAMLGAGWGIAHLGYCPLVKRIWTPSWAVFSTGWTLLMLGGFYGVIDGLRWRGWAFPLVVAGMNSMALYLMGQLSRGWTGDTIKRHFGAAGSLALEGLNWVIAALRTQLGWGWLVTLDESFQPIFESCAVLAVFWLIVYWLYRQRVFLKI